MGEDEHEVYFQDECHFKLTLTIIRAWFLKGTNPEIRSPTDRFKMSVFGAMGVNGQLVIEQSDMFNAVTFQKFLEKLIAEARVGKTKAGKKKKLLLVLLKASSAAVSGLSGLALLPLTNKFPISGGQTRKVLLNLIFSRNHKERPK